MMTTRYRHFIAQILPSRVQNWIEARWLNKRFNHENYGLGLTKGYLNFFSFNGKIMESISLTLFYSELQMFGSWDAAFAYSVLSLFLEDGVHQVLQQVLM